MMGLSARHQPFLRADSPPTAVTLTVSAASDLRDVFPEIGQAWEAETGHSLRFNFGSTGQLAQQIARGAPVDVFAAANRQFVDDLDREGLVFPETKALYGVGRITLWQREEASLDINRLEDLLKPEVRRVAIANPNHAPYGTAAKEALEAAGIWEEIQPKLIFGENISQTQQYAMTGNVDVAIAALSISVEKPGRWELISDTLHHPLEQMLAVPKNAPYPQEAKEFAAFINGEQGRPLMEKYGFVVPDSPETP